MASISLFQIYVEKTFIVLVKKSFIFLPLFQIVHINMYDVSGNGIQLYICNEFYFNNRKMNKQTQTVCVTAALVLFHALIFTIFQSVMLQTFM